MKERVWRADLEGEVLVVECRGEMTVFTVR